MTLFSIPDMANTLEVCPETIRKYIKQLKFVGEYKNIGHHQNVLFFSQSQFDMIRDTIESNKVVERNYYTSKDVAELAGCSVGNVSAISLEFNIYKIVKPTGSSRKAYFPKESADKIIDIVQLRRDRRYNAAREKAKTIADVSDEKEELHPLVINKEFLKLSVWPDTMPECFADLDA